MCSVRKNTIATREVVAKWSGRALKTNVANENEHNHSQTCRCVNACSWRCPLRPCEKLLFASKELHALTIVTGRCSLHLEVKYAQKLSISIKCPPLTVVSQQLHIRRPSRSRCVMSCKRQLCEMNDAKHHCTCNADRVTGALFPKHFEQCPDELSGDVLIESTDNPKRLLYTPHNHSLASNEPNNDFGSFPSPANWTRMVNIKNVWQNVSQETVRRSHDITIQCTLYSRENVGRTPSQMRTRVIARLCATTRVRLTDRQCVLITVGERLDEKISLQCKQS